jgi:hypothetical protein
VNFCWITFLAFKNQTSDIAGFSIVMFNVYSIWRKYMILDYAILALSLIYRWWLPHEVCASSAEPLCLMDLTFWIRLLLRLLGNVCNIQNSIKSWLLLEARKVKSKIFLRWKVVVCVREGMHVLSYKLLCQLNNYYIFLDAIWPQKWKNRDKKPVKQEQSLVCWKPCGKILGDRSSVTPTS